MEKNFFEWIVFLLQKYGDYYMQGTITTLKISVIGTVVGYLIGLGVGVIRTIPVTESDGGIRKMGVKLLNMITGIYVGIFRGTPMIVQAMVIYYGTLQVMNIDLSPFTASLFIVGLNTGAYMSETVRGGVISIDNGQIEGAKAIGMSHFQTMIYVVIPQVLRNIMPQMGNTFISNIKDTSVLNVVAVTELFFVTKSAAGTYYRYFEAYVITALIYLVLTIVFSFILKIIERLVEGRKSYSLVDIETL